jgi:hypothetical protein
MLTQPSLQPAPGCAQFGRSFGKSEGSRHIQLKVSFPCERTDRPDDCLAAFVDMDVLDADVLFAAAPQAPVRLDLGAVGAE